MNKPHTQRTRHGEASTVRWAPQLLRAILLIGMAAGLPAPTLQGEDGLGSAVLTSRSGTLQVAADGELVTPVELRESILPADQTWATGDQSRAFLALSNGTAIAIGESTELRFERYRQRPFEPENEGFASEPSVSELSLELNSGSIALACRHLSPISGFRIQLPQGSLRIHRGVAFISYDPTGLHLAVVEGNLTYYYPGGDVREFVSEGMLLRISDQSAQRQSVAETRPIDSLPANAINLYRAATAASQRVFFQANAETGAPPKPVMVVREAYYDQPSPRPYEFKK